MAIDLKLMTSCWLTTRGQKIERIAKKWTMPVQNWKASLHRFAILLGNRVPKMELA